jgi:hypothetical protein
MALDTHFPPAAPPQLQNGMQAEGLMMNYDRESACSLQRKIVNH